ncbi:hypothetical protein GJ496_002091 [Pomphorhynchus laevis]|nr:hypothetical protein GJ496_002091 [Pomphorhynchus laevis]
MKNHGLQHHQKRSWSYRKVTATYSKLLRRRIFLEQLGKALVTAKTHSRARFPKTSEVTAIIKISKFTSPNKYTMDLLNMRLKKLNKSGLSFRSESKTSICWVKCQKFICIKHIIAICLSCREQ